MFGLWRYIRMIKWRRSERVGALLDILTRQPCTLFSLKDFSNRFDCSKSTISEDLAIVRTVLQRLQRGHIETIAGAAGGVRYIPGIGKARRQNGLTDLCTRLSAPDRILPGGYLYMTDCIYDPQVNNQLGEIFATRFATMMPDVVVTVETKGIPLAVATAFFLNVPVVAARRDHLVTEGSSVSINYVSGSSRSIQTMSLARRSLAQGARVLIIDDFMRGGGTIKGLFELMTEFKAQVVGVGVLLSTALPQHKLVKDYVSLTVLEEVNEETRQVVVRPSAWIDKQLFL